MKDELLNHISNIKREITNLKSKDIISDDYTSIDNNTINTVISVIDKYVVDNIDTIEE